MNKQLAQLVGLTLAVLGTHGHHEGHEHDAIHATVETLNRLGEDENEHQLLILAIIGE